MARRTITIEEKIERQKKVVFAAKEKYDKAVEELTELQKKQKELQGKEILQAFAESDKTLEEILNFLKNSLVES